MSAEVYNRIRLLSAYEKLMMTEDDIAGGKVNDAFDAVDPMVFPACSQNRETD